MARTKKTKRIPVRSWEQYPELPGAVPVMREQLQKRKRHKNARYLLFRLRTLAEKGLPPPETFDDVTLPPGFVEHFLTAQIEIVELPDGKKARIVEGRTRTPMDIGGFLTFGARWDIDEELRVYSRHRSVHALWNDKLRHITPVLGSDD